MANISEVTSIEKGKDMKVSSPSRSLRSFEDMEHWFENLFQRKWMHPLAGERPLWADFELPSFGKMPSVDIIDQDENVLVRAEVPGIDKKDLNVSVTDGTVTIEGKSSREETEEKGNYYRCEISRGSFSRTLALPHEVDADRAKASFKDGLLELTIPKVKKTNRRQVKVD